MKNVKSLQVGVSFAFCPSPITIDKRDPWGPDAMQVAPDGGFLKMKSPAEVSHLVQPNADKSAPIGWIPGSAPGLFDKSPIWVDDSRVIEVGEKITIDTKDGKIEYEAKKPSLVTYNGDENGPDMSDGWLSSIDDIEKNYEFKMDTTSAS